MKTSLSIFALAAVLLSGSLSANAADETPKANTLTEAEQRAGVSVVDQPKGLGLVERAADHLGVRGRAHRLSFPDPGGSVREEHCGARLDVGLPLRH